MISLEIAVLRGNLGGYLHGEARLHVSARARTVFQFEASIRSMKIAIYRFCAAQSMLHLFNYDGKWKRYYRTV